MRQKRRKLFAPTPLVLPLVKLAPDLERTCAAQPFGKLGRVLNHSNHLEDFVADRFVRVFGEPFRRQKIPGDSHGDLAIDLYTRSQKGVRNAGHRGDTVLERHARLQIHEMKVTLTNGDRMAGHGGKVIADLGGYQTFFRFGNERRSIQTGAMSKPMPLLSEVTA